MTVPFKTQFFSQPNISSSHIIDRTITTSDIALGTIDISNLSTACIASLSGGGGGLTANSVNSSHIINGSILTEDISNHAITFDKLAVNSVGNTRIINGAVTHAKLSSDCVQSHNIVDGTILGTDISSATITGSNIASDTIVFNNLEPDLQTFITRVYTGIFEITCNTSINVDFYYEKDAEKIYLFQNEELIGDGEKTFLVYHPLPPNFAVIPFYLLSDEAIQSYSLTYASPTNGIVSHSQTGAGRIQFNILRNSQHYLELDINIDI